MKKIVIGVICLAGFVQAQTVQDLNSLSAYSNEINAGSARYLGMGGSMGALGGDISSIEQNPAGLAVAIASDVNVTVGLNTYNNQAKFGNTYETKDNNLMFQNVGATFVFKPNAGNWNRFSVGIKYSQENLDNWIRLGRNENIRTSLVDSIGTTNYTMNGYQDQVVGFKTKMSLNFGATYNERLFLGLGLNMHETQYDNYIVFDEDTNGQNYRYDLNGSPYSAIGTGVSVSAGVIGKINDNVRLGLAYHSPVWYGNIEENYYADLEVSENNYVYDLWYSQYDRNSNGRLVASAGFVLAKSLALNLDYTLNMNSSTKLKPSGNFNTVNSFLEDNYKSSSEVRVGGEYRLDKFRLRAGYNYVQSPFDELSLAADMGNGQAGTYNFDNAIRGDINRFSVGAGYDFGGFYLDAAYQFQNQKYSYVFGNGEYVDYDAGDVYLATIPLHADHNFVSEIENKRGLFLVTAGWQF